MFHLYSMDSHVEIENDTPTIADLYPQLSPEEQLEAARRLARYLELVSTIFERSNDLTES
jgi:hypothetical protein